MAQLGQQDAALPLRDSLFKRIRNSQNFSANRAGFYGVLNGALRVSIIVLAALAAGAKEIANLTPAQPYLSVSVVILTGLDTWVQAGTKWKAHYRYNDDYIAAETELSGIPPD
jgi:hypothetical protein